MNFLSFAQRFGLKKYIILQKCGFTGANLVKYVNIIKK